ncbi:MAG: TldD/PmbA family protein [Clostridia bacterium]|nr:TldD/PmbA family protein [Clostridia bacterium]
MKNLLKQILTSMTNIDGWHILERKIESSEVFYVKDAIDMNRMKNVHHFDVTVYKDFEENNNRYKGSSRTKIAPTMSADEIKEALEDAAYAATFVKNQHYPLIQGYGEQSVVMPSDLSNKHLIDWVPEITKVIYKNEDTIKGINSAELFLNRNHYAILNSEGVDIAYDNHDVELEFITNWKNEGEEVESYKHISFSDLNKEQIATEIQTMIEISKEKASAEDTPSLKGINVLLTGEPAKTMFDYYLTHASAKSVYEQISTFKIGESVQGNFKGDAVTITLEPMLKNSSHARPFDGDGLQLKTTELIKNGKLINYWGGARFAHYLDLEPVGNIDNIVVEPGSKSIEAMKSEPYLELLEFSDFQMNGLTGDFAGEIRLGRYFDGHKVVPVTTGSISGNIHQVQEEFYLSTEIHQINNYKGPKTMQLLNMDIAGN